MLYFQPAIHGHNPHEIHSGSVLFAVENRTGVFSRYPKENLAQGVSQTEEEHAYARQYTIFWASGISLWTGSIYRGIAGKGSRDECEFRRRVKTQGSLPSAQAAELLLFGLIISGHRMGRIDGWQDLKQVSLLIAA